MVPGANGNARGIKDSADIMGVCGLKGKGNDGYFFRCCSRDGKARNFAQLFGRIGKELFLAGDRKYVEALRRVRL